MILFPVAAWCTLGWKRLTQQSNTNFLALPIPEFTAQLETRRLLLSPCRLEDEQALLALWTNERVRSFLFDDRIISAEESRSHVETSLRNFAEHGYGIWVIRERNQSQIIGFAGLLHFTEKVPNLIYGIHPDFWGIGYATEAAKRVLSYAREIGLAEVKADVDEPNLPSVRVLEKLGMRRVRRAIVEERPLLYFDCQLEDRSV